MESLFLGIRVILPIICYMMLGYIFRRTKLAEEKTFLQLNKITFRSFLPIMIVNNIYNSDIAADFDIRVFFYALACVMLNFALAVVIVNAVYRGRPAPTRSVVIQGLYRSNFVIFGMSVTASICGPNNLGMASILVAVVVPIYNVLAVFLFTVYGAEHKGWKNIAVGIAKNPLIIASVIGLIIKFSGLNWGSTVGGIMGTLGGAATPIALICLGGTFAFSGLKTYGKELVFTTVGKLIAVPLVFVAIAVFMGIRGSNLVALMVMLASPVAVSSFVMAGEMGGNRELAGDIVVCTSVFAVFTVFAFVVALSAMGLIA